VNIQDAYNRWSTTYDTDRNLTRDLDQRVTRDALAGHRFRSILELGCGTGKNTALLVQVGERVCSLDFSAGMIAQARQKLHFDHLSFALADLTQAWPCRSEAADLVTCNLVLEHIQDLSPIFAEAKRVLTASGLFFVCELHPFRQYQGRQANFQHGQETIEVPAFIHHISDFTQQADQHDLSLVNLKEWWHEQDESSPPRLVSFLFTKMLGEEN
jgi:ubiquinone/menaquinone biosynthesis C-methylase UbiE